MAATRTDPECELRVALERLETALATPIVGGELVAWIKDVQKAWHEASAQIHYHTKHVHARQFSQISNEDPELIPQTEKLRAVDAEIETDREELNRLLQRLAEHAPKFEPDEEKIREHVDGLADAGTAFINRVRKQEVAMRTWFVEAFNRDRGVAD
jgi:hypothetical protein